MSSNLRLAVPAEVDCQDSEPGPREDRRLLSPTLLVEATSVNKHDAAIASSVLVGVDEPPVRRRKRHGLR